MTAHPARAIARATISLLAGALLLAVPAPAADIARCPGALDTPIAATTDEARDTVMCLVNAERTNHGRRPLRRDGDLTQAAGHHASDMARRNYFAHVSPGGADLGDRLRDAGYGQGSAWRAGEALGWGTGSRSTPGALVDEWLDSPPHRHILLDPSWRELGVGVAAGAPRPNDSGLPGATYALDAGVVRGG